MFKCLRKLVCDPSPATNWLVKSFQPHLADPFAVLETDRSIAIFAARAALHFQNNKCIAARISSLKGMAATTTGNAGVAAAMTIA
jgi:hypothetical protein